MSEPTAEEYAEALYEAMFILPHVKSDADRVELIAAALLAAEARGRAEGIERCAKEIDDHIQNEYLPLGEYNERRLRELRDAIRALDAAAVSREEKR